MKYFSLILLLILLGACEQEFIPDLSEDNQKIIVEGHIEMGTDALPPYVLVSRSLPFFGTIRPEDITDAQIRDANVSVRVDDMSFVLPQLCLSDLPPEIRDEITAQINIIPDIEGSDFCVYIDLSGSIPLQEESIYELKIELPTGERLRASTTIPRHVPLNDFRFTSPPGSVGNDSLARLLCRIEDPAAEDNYYRYLTAENNGPFIAGFSSVTDDGFFNGQSFEFPLQKAEGPQDAEDTDPSEFGLYDRGDTIRIKWLNIDREHYEFWNTFEFNLNNQGPFSTYTRVSSNVEGALGIWGGYSSSVYTLIVPQE